MFDELTVRCDVSEKLETAKIAFMLTGSIALNYYVEPRTTVVI
jgi:hypothetical protein